jgi:hypothetical protein
VCVRCFCKSFPLTDLKKREHITIASSPEILMIAMAPAPEGVANAIILSLLVIIKIYAKIVKKYFKTKILDASI